MPSVEGLAIDLRQRAASQGFKELPITVEHSVVAGFLPRLDRDPFDRMLTAQALVSDLVIVSNELMFDQYSVRRLW